jgi:hypothetical protein
MAMAMGIGNSDGDGVGNNNGDGNNDRNGNGHGKGEDDKGRVASPCAGDVQRYGRGNTLPPPPWTVVSHIDMYCTNVLMYRMMVLLARPTKVRR